MAIALAQERVVFILKAADAEGDCIERDLIDEYMAKFGVTRMVAQEAIFKQTYYERITRKEVEGDEAFRTYHLAITEMGRWCLLAETHPRFSHILLIRHRVWKEVIERRLRVCLLDAIDDEIRRLIDAGLEHIGAPTLSA
ncbi:MAG TPA: hypothetical protein VMW58_10470 [Anaerolineae bacterium]|nr:hypothetical protein [Anaerolineae bacterium]